MSGLTGHGGGRQSDGKLYGCVVGIVTDNAHPAHDYRVRVRFPWLPGNDQSTWARIVTPMASRDGCGAFFLPEVDDEVLVVFENGDFNHPVVVGALWNGVDKPAYCNRDGKSETERFHGNDARFKSKTDPKKNDLRGLSTRKRHELLFNDNSEQPAVVLASGQKHRIVLSDADNQPTQIEIYDGKEENYILIDTKNKRITVESKSGDVVLRAKKTLRLECERLEVDARRDVDAKAAGSLAMKSSGNLSVKANGSGEVEAAGTLTLRGAVINLN